MSASVSRKILLVAASPAAAPHLGDAPVGFWASELVHPYLEFTEAGYEVEIASPAGGHIELDAFSDPRHESGYSADDWVSLGFLTSPKTSALLESTKKLDSVALDDYDAIVVAGGQAPMFTFRENPTLQRLLAAFFEAGKPTAALCHGVSALIDVRLSDGKRLIEGKTVTGFSNAEEDEVDRAMGTQVMPWRIEDAAREAGADFVSDGVWKSFAVRDGRLVTGQQQHSGRRTAQLVLEALGE